MSSQGPAAAAGPKRLPSSGTAPKRAPPLPRKKPPSENGSTTASATTAGRRTKSNANRLSGIGERTVKRLRLSKALTIPEGTTVLDACRRMATRRVDAALLTDASALLCGIITDKDVATRVIAEGLKPEETLVSKVMTRNPLFVMSDTLAVDALQKMVQGKFRHLPVVENGEVVALLDITKCLYDAIARMERAAEKGDAIAAAVQGVEQQWGTSASASTNFIEVLREKMFRPSLGSIIENAKVATVLPSDTVYVATKRMRELRVSSVIITSNNKPQGILTSKDVLLRVIAQNLPPESTPVEKVMTANPECATIDTSIVDALHTMHDGKFLHLPVVDREGSIVACLDVLHLTHAAVATVGNVEGSADITSIMMQKFWDSAFASEGADDEDDSHSDISITKSSADNLVSDHLKYPTLGLGSSFTFKLEDSKGRVHRFNCGAENLTELISTIAQRLGDDFDVRKSPHIMYEDDEGDHVILATDNDLVNAVNHAKLSGWKVLKLHLDYPQAVEKRASRDLQSDTKLTNTCGEMIIESQQNWGTSAYTAAVAGAAVVVGLSMLVLLKRPNT